MLIYRNFDFIYLLCSRNKQYFYSNLSQQLLAHVRQITFKRIFVKQHIPKPTLTSKGSIKTNSQANIC